MKAKTKKLSKIRKHLFRKVYSSTWSRLSILYSLTSLFQAWDTLCSTIFP